MTRPQFEKLVMEYGNAQFFAGEWDGEDAAEYEAVYKRVEAAREELFGAFDALTGDKVESGDPMKRDGFTINASDVKLGEMSPNTARPVSFTVYGQCYSMKNSKDNHHKHPKCVAFERDFGLQVPPRCKLALGSRETLLRTTVTVYYPTWKQDLDVSVVYDLLQKTGVITNDRWIRQKREVAFVDPVNPRVHIQVEELGE